MEKSALEQERTSFECLESGLRGLCGEFGFKEPVSLKSLSIHSSDAVLCDDTCLPEPAPSGTLGASSYATNQVAVAKSGGVHMFGPSMFKATIKPKGKKVHLSYFSTP